MWYLFVFGVILYSCGMVCDRWLMFFIVKLMLVFCVIVSRCRIVLVELFIVMLSVIVFLNVLKLIECGSMCLLFCL